MLAHRVLVLAALAIFSPACGKRRVQPGAIPPAAPAELTTPEGAQEADDADDEDDDDEDVSDDGFAPAPRAVKTGANRFTAASFAASSPATPKPRGAPAPESDSIAATCGSLPWASK